MSLPHPMRAVKKGNFSRCPYLNPLNPSLSRKSYRPLLARRPDADRTGAQLDGSGELQLLAVEAQDLDLPFRCGLIQKGAVVLAPGYALAPVADLGLRDEGQLRPVHAIDFQETEIVEERRVLRFVRAVDAVHRQIGSIGR